MTHAGKTPCAEVHTPCNFRDIGGYQTTLGQTVQKGMVFRSANFDLNHEVVLDALYDLYGIKVVFDLRSTGERTTKTSSTSTLVVSLPAVAKPEKEILTTYFHGLSLDNPAAAYAQMYLHICTTSATAFATLFEHIRDNLPQSPLLVHCELGKDRTGVFIAVLQFVLGVCDDSIVDDYVLSNEAVKPLTAKRNVKLLNAEFMKDVPSSSLAIERHSMALPSSMRSFLALLRDTYGDAEGYMRSIGFGLEDIIQIRLNLTL